MSSVDPNKLMAIADSSNIKLHWGVPKFMEGTVPKIIVKMGSPNFVTPVRTSLDGTDRRGREVRGWVANG